MEDSAIKQYKSPAQLFRERQKENQEKLETEVNRLQSEIAHYSLQLTNLRDENEVLRQKLMFLRYFLQEVLSSHNLEQNNLKFAPMEEK